MARIENFGFALKEIPVDRGEVLRYMAAKDPNDEILRVIDECIAETEAALSPGLCYEEYDVFVNGDEVDFGAFKVRSRDLAKNLRGCRRAVIFAATLGLGVDRLISRYKTISPIKSLCISAVGSERVEALCEVFCDKLREEYGCVRPRYSAGYGDLSLELQRDVFRTLDCTKSIGVSLSESLLMTPVKSVTAIVGVEK
jgi:hypothetical protein